MRRLQMHDGCCGTVPAHHQERAPQLVQVAGRPDAGGQVDRRQRDPGVLLLIGMLAGFAASRRSSMPRGRG